eukprot:1605455-Amphidinium_carterae.1
MSSFVSELIQVILASDRPSIAHATLLDRAQGALHPNTQNCEPHTTPSTHPHHIADVHGEPITPMCRCDQKCGTTGCKVKGKRNKTRSCEEPQWQSHHPFLNAS